MATTAFNPPKLERGLANNLTDGWDENGAIVWMADLCVLLEGNQTFRLGPCTGFTTAEVRDMHASAEAEAVRWWENCLKAAKDRGVPWWEIDPMTVL